MVGTDLVGWASVVTAFVSVFGFAYTVMQGRNLARERIFRSVLMSHLYVMQGYNSLKKRALGYSRGLRDVYFLTVFLINVLIVYSLYSVSISNQNEKLVLLFLVIIVWGNLLNIVFIFVKKSLISEARLYENDVKRNLRGSTGIFLLSVIMFMMVVLLVPNSPLHTILPNQTAKTHPTIDVSNFNAYYSGSIIIAGIGIILSAILFSSIIDTGTALLWKIDVSDSKKALADKLPHLIVKTKIGNVFFGQLYDPLDDKLLILRNAKLVVHSGQEVADTLVKVVPHEVLPNKQEDYLLIPWDEIEALQIVEKGLYMASETDTENKNKSVDIDKTQKNKQESRER